MSVITALFVLALAGIASGMITGVAKVISRRGGSRAELAELEGIVRQYAAELEDAQSSLASHAAQLAELQERVDFAERILAQVRDRKALRPGEGEAPPSA
jgi:Tfp pilus assembly protein FimV